MCIFDEYEDELLEDDICLLLGWIAAALNSVGLLENAADAHVDRVAGEAFLDGDGNVRESLNFAEFFEWMQTNEHTKKVLGTVEMLPRMQDACQLILYRTSNLTALLAEISGVAAQGAVDPSTLQHIEAFSATHLTRL